MVENEIKFMLEKSEYVYLKENIFDKNDYVSKIQVNYYYDTMNYDLLKERITLRVRQVENVLMLQAKYPISNDGTVRKKEEKEIKINNLTSKINLNDENLVKAIGDLRGYGKVYLMGCLVTHRLSLIYNSWMRLDLDANIYLGKIDYELEVEIMDGFGEEAKKIINSILPNNHITNEFGKMKRFFHAKQKLA